MGCLDGKVCVVTGAGGSLGRASAAAFLAEGAKVLLVDRDEDKLGQSAAAIGRAMAPAPGEIGSDRLATRAADVARSADTRGYLAAAERAFGGLDVLFSNAGIWGALAPIPELDEAVFDEVMAVNVRASFLALKYGLPRMREGGAAILTSSIVGTTSAPGIAAYATSKHALIGLARTAAKEAAARDIRVNILAPGPIDNDFQAGIETRLSEMAGRDMTEALNQQIPLGRHAKPEEVAKMALFLASDQSSFSTGSVFFADGGMNI